MSNSREVIPAPTGAHWFTESSLEESFQPGECLICSNQNHAERRAIHSFLFEGMMASSAREQFLAGGGFCARHFWIAKQIETDCWRAGGIGLAILCENLVERALSRLLLTADPHPHQLLRSFRRHRDSFSTPLSGEACMFCEESARRETALIETLEELNLEPKWRQKLKKAPLCLHHGVLALRLWDNALRKQELRHEMETLLVELQFDLKEFIRKHDWNYRNEPLGRERNAVQRAIRALTGLERQFSVQQSKAHGDQKNGTRKR